MEKNILVIDDKEILASPGKLPGNRNGKYIFKLFMAGQTPRAEKTGQWVRSIFDDTLKDQYVLAIIDVIQDPSATDDDNVFATPTLIKIHPEPAKRIMGDLSNKERVLIHLGIAS
jgi:circadian clock protein KaiB